ncbi:hypothetical protein S83_028929 [Arachis hypogaea]|nr:uncharacterized protein DS421_9g270810 [Arachis hypogaea]
MPCRRRCRRSQQPNVPIFRAAATSTRLPNDCAPSASCMPLWHSSMSPCGDALSTASNPFLRFKQPSPILPLISSLPVWLVSSSSSMHESLSPQVLTKKFKEKV